MRWDCSAGIVNGELVPIDPEAWAIVDGKLYLNNNIAGRDEFVQNPISEIAKADAGWARLQLNAQ